MAFYSEAVVWNCNLFQVKWHPDAYIQPCFSQMKQFSRQNFLSFVREIKTGDNREFYN